MSDSPNKALPTSTAPPGQLVPRTPTQRLSAALYGSDSEGENEERVRPTAPSEDDFTPPNEPADLSSVPPSLTFDDPAAVLSAGLSDAQIAALYEEQTARDLDFLRQVMENPKPTTNNASRNPFELLALERRHRRTAATQTTRDATAVDDAWLDVNGRRADQLCNELCNLVNTLHHAPPGTRWCWPPTRASFLIEMPGTPNKGIPEAKGGSPRQTRQKAEESAFNTDIHNRIQEISRTARMLRNAIPFPRSDYREPPKFPSPESPPIILLPPPQFTTDTIPEEEIPELEDGMVASGFTNFMSSLIPEEPAVDSWEDYDKLSVSKARRSRRWSRLLDSPAAVSPAKTPPAICKTPPKLCEASPTSSKSPVCKPSTECVASSKVSPPKSPVKSSPKSTPVGKPSTKILQKMPKICKESPTSSKSHVCKTSTECVASSKVSPPKSPNVKSLPKSSPKSPLVGKPSTKITQKMRIKPSEKNNNVNTKVNERINGGSSKLEAMHSGIFGARPKTSSKSVWGKVPGKPSELEVRKQSQDSSTSASTKSSSLTSGLPTSNLSSPTQVRLGWGAMGVHPKSKAQCGQTKAQSSKVPNANKKKKQTESSQAKEIRSIKGGMPKKSNAAEGSSGESALTLTILPKVPTQRTLVAPAERQRSISAAANPIDKPKPCHKLEVPNKKLRTVSSLTKVCKTENLPTGKLPPRVPSSSGKILKGFSSIAKDAVPKKTISTADGCSVTQKTSGDTINSKKTIKSYNRPTVSVANKKKAPITKSSSILSKEHNVCSGSKRANTVAAKVQSAVHSPKAVTAASKNIKHIEENSSTDQKQIHQSTDLLVFTVPTSEAVSSKIVISETKSSITDLEGKPGPSNSPKDVTTENRNLDYKENPASLNYMVLSEISITAEGRSSAKITQGAQSMDSTQQAVGCVYNECSSTTPVENSDFDEESRVPLKETQQKEHVLASGSDPKEPSNVADAIVTSKVAFDDVSSSVFVPTAALGHTLDSNATSIKKNSIETPENVPFCNLLSLEETSDVLADGAMVASRNASESIAVSTSPIKRASDIVADSSSIIPKESSENASHDISAVTAQASALEAQLYGKSTLSATDVFKDCPNTPCFEMPSKEKLDILDDATIGSKAVSVDISDSAAVSADELLGHFSDSFTDLSSNVFTETSALTNPTFLEAHVSDFSEVLTLKLSGEAPETASVCKVDPSEVPTLDIPEETTETASNDKEISDVLHSVTTLTDPTLTIEAHVSDFSQVLTLKLSGEAPEIASVCKFAPSGGVSEDVSHSVATSPDPTSVLETYVSDSSTVPTLQLSEKASETTSDCKEVLPQGIAEDFSHSIPAATDPNLKLESHVSNSSTVSATNFSEEKPKTFPCFTTVSCEEASDVPDSATAVSKTGSDYNSRLCKQFPTANGKGSESHVQVLNASELESSSK